MPSKGVAGPFQAKTYGWQEAQATFFVLTDVPPGVSLVWATLHRWPPSAMPRKVTLELDLSLTEQQVAKIYRKSRQSIMKKDANGRPAYRGLGDKRLMLAKFIAELPDDMSDREKMNQLNRQLPKWKYKYLSEFKRD